MQMVKGGVVWMESGYRSEADQAVERRNHLRQVCDGQLPCKAVPRGAASCQRTCQHRNHAM